MLIEDLLKIKYLTILRYSPRGSNIVEKKSKGVKNDIKTWNAASKLITAIKDVMDEYTEAIRFLENSTLVPIPGSSLIQKDTLRVPLEICKVLNEIVFSASICDCLERIKPIQSSKFGYNISDRPSVQTHLDSIKLNPQLIETKRIVLVDDVITRGTTAISCAKILSDFFPSNEIVVFALLRPTERIQEGEKIRYLEKGEIILFSDWSCNITKIS